MLMSTFNQITTFENVGYLVYRKYSTKNQSAAKRMGQIKTNCVKVIRCGIKEFMGKKSWMSFAKNASKVFQMHTT